MRASMAYFAGAGTVVAAIVAGLGGGVVISDIVSPHGSREPSKLEQRASSQQAQPAQSPQANVASNAPGEPVPYLAATRAAITPAVVAPAPSGSPQPVTESNNAAPRGPAKAEKTEATALTDTAKPAQAPAPQPSPQAPQQASRDPNADNAYAKARDADLKELEAKKKAERAERRQQWAARRAQQREQERQQREQQRDTEQQANEERRPGTIIVRRDDRDDRWRNDREDRREDRRPGEIVVRRDDRDGSDRQDFDRPTQFGFPRFNLFGQD